MADKDIKARIDELMEAAEPQNQPRDQAEASGSQNPPRQVHIQNYCGDHGFQIGGNIIFLGSESKIKDSPELSGLFHRILKVFGK